MAEWAKLPTAWILKADSCPLIDLTWAKHRVQATAALVILIALAIKLNQSHRSQPVKDRKPEVAVTYDDLQAMTGFARATITKALMLLEGFGALEIRKEGRMKVYALPQVDQNGSFCQLPQTHLLWDHEEDLHRIRKLPVHYRAGLNAMKMYVLFLAFRNYRLNTTAISYESIMKYTGMRRADIPEAFSLLVATEMARASDDSDPREHDKSKRYRIIGLHSIR